MTGSSQKGSVIPGYRVIPGFPDYMVNRFGTVKSIRFHKTMRGKHESTTFVYLRKDGKTYQRSVSRLMYDTWPDLRLSKEWNSD